ncbi:preprotein translocase subunit SecE [Patescibacteria group bacterium]|uniref:Protein translocase subunit SecE n=1 Tax=candidate division WWE3 bacterium TaxID=2053526 RepID=A0A928TQI7_UNCKA|nr:preprotein translocase subunit SecE [candidate division WWE3 bacterium]MCL4732377.1 preprotein translocase subunit SecE [Patescibacteria group bacterium]MDL1952802.1 preprotein translocase subunit SecE [Candidatus Uhrbacteria bacterium UHB]RIL01038.1 MAG: preprotein translocase subunit SecE [Candidatus Uhrbacteria bacterium]
MANILNAIPHYIKSSWAELKKVSWPSRDMTIRYSAIVVAASLTLAVLFAALDFGFSNMVRIVLTAARGNAPATETSPAEQPIIPDLQATPDAEQGNVLQFLPDGVDAENASPDSNLPGLPTGDGNTSPIELPPVQ